ncbi:MAG: hypothetical protein AAGJ35_14455, partial [Myxococcota bacterium]
MIRIAQSSLMRRNLPKHASLTQAWKSTKAPSASPMLAGDAGAFATHAHHTMTTFLAVATPVVFIMPDSMTDGIIDQVFGSAVAVTVAGHSWVG